MSKRKLSKENVAEIKKLYEEGKTLMEIARIFKIHHTSVLYWVKDVPKKLRIKTPGKRRPNIYKKKNNYETGDKFLKGNGMYAEYLKKHISRQPNPDLPISQLFASKMLKK